MLVVFCFAYNIGENCLLQVQADLLLLINEGIKVVGVYFQSYLLISFVVSFRNGRIQVQLIDSILS
jgi:hypothetical protein